MNNNFSIIIIKRMEGKSEMRLHLIISYEDYYRRKIDQ